LLNTLKAGVLFGLWYLFNIWYSLVAKMVLQWWKSPWLFAMLQLSIGSLWVVLQWVPLPTFGLWGSGKRFAPLRPAPSLTRADLCRLAPIAACLAAGHLASTFAMFYGTVAFANVVKTAEPIFTCFFSAALLRQFFSLPVYATLLPIMGGVAYASAKELQFSWISLGTAMASNVAFALRAILAKVSMGATGSSAMSPADLFAVVNMLGSAMLIPVALLVEGRGAADNWASSLAKGVSQTQLVKLIVATGVTYYLYNELAFMCLGVVHPITHAVANTIKRVAVIAISILYFNNPVTREGILGSAIAVVGVLLYSLALGQEKAKATTKVAQAQK